jgi:hypothetical protein
MQSVSGVESLFVMANNNRFDPASPAVYQVQRTVLPVSWSETSLTTLRLCND